MNNNLARALVMVDYLFVGSRYVSFKFYTANGY
jgi:hypothetical protein